MPLSLRALVPLLAAVALGCTTPVVDDVADANAGMTEGMVLVERMVAVDGTTQTNVSAKFMRLSDPDLVDLAERVVGAKLDLPAVGTCRPVSLATVKSKPRTLSSLGTIELMDVGDVTLRIGDSSMPLAARAFPDVGDLVSGMFYTSRDTASDLPAGETYTIEGTGSGLVDRFAVEAVAPPALEDVRLDGVALAEGPVLEEGGPFAMRWRAPEVPTRGDLVVVDVSARSGASVQCVYEDVGRALLPPRAFGSGVLGPLPAAATIAVHRLRARSSTTVPGIDAVEVRFDTSVVGRVVVSRKTPLP